MSHRDELENIILDLTGRLELSEEEVKALQEAEDKLERLMEMCSG